MLRNILISIGVALLSFFYPLSTYLLFKLALSSGFYFEGMVVRLIFNTVIFLFAAVICTTLFCLLIRGRALLFFGYCCSVSSILYWYILCPVIYQVNNLLSDYSTWYMLAISTFFPLLMTFCIVQYLTSKGTESSKAAPLL